MFALLAVALVILIVAGWLRVLWLFVKHPVLSLPIAAYIGLVLWLGANNAQALTIYALIVLAIWRLTHKHSFQRLLGRRVHSSWQRSWAYDPPPARHHDAVGSGETPPDAPAHPDDPDRSDPHGSVTAGYSTSPSDKTPTTASGSRQD